MAKKQKPEEYHEYSYDNAAYISKKPFKAFVQGKVKEQPFYQGSKMSFHEYEYNERVFPKGTTLFELVGGRIIPVGLKCEHVNLQKPEGVNLFVHSFPDEAGTRGGLLSKRVFKRLPLNPKESGDLYTKMCEK